MQKVGVHIGVQIREFVWCKIRTLYSSTPLALHPNPKQHVQVSSYHSPHQKSQSPAHIPRAWTLRAPPHPILPLKPAHPSPVKAQPRGLRARPEMRFSLGIVNAVALELLIVCSLVPDSNCTTVSSGSVSNSNTRDGRDAGNQLNRDF